MHPGETMSIQSLGYVVVGTRDLEAWGRFGRDILGLMTSAAPDGDKAIHLRIDDRPLRIRVEESDQEGLVACGWELRDASTFESAITDLKGAGVDVEIASEDLCSQRCARGVARFSDPAGNPHEIYYGTIYDHKPFVSPVGSAGFVTGPLGMGHVVLPAPNLAECRDLFTNVLGFRISDTLEGPVSLAFLHCNPRHHSLALASFPHPAGLVHFMLELNSLDDVGYALDRVEQANLHLSATLGKHTNDHVVSFYVRSPSGFDVEVGCQGLLVDDATWTTSEITAPSFWGHRWDYSPGGTDE
jgi:3,4-dihydroxy-9,10-secoandrosta-1,3,5(10)-triene-9,17-dione 4,5-dioxygenase